MNEQFYNLVADIAGGITDTAGGKSTEDGLDWPGIVIQALRKIGYQLPSMNASGIYAKITKHASIPEKGMLLFSRPDQEAGTNDWEHVAICAEVNELLLSSGQTKKFDLCKLNKEMVQTKQKEFRCLDWNKLDKESLK